MEKKKTSFPCPELQQAMPNESRTTQKSASPLSSWSAVLAAAGVLLFIASQLVSQFQVQISLGSQLGLLRRQAAVFESEIARLRTLEEEEQKLYSQAESVSQGYQEILKDLLALASSNTEAMDVVTKFHIRKIANPAAP
jgi:hypothetical protein